MKLLVEVNFADENFTDHVFCLVKESK